MDAKEWLEARRPPPPVKLAARLGKALGDFAIASDISLCETLAVAGAAILNCLTDGNAPTSRREVAIDLLSADALLTYALEAAAEDCESFAASADAMIARLASLAPAGRA
jgi:hypothetical protein